MRTELVEVTPEGRMLLHFHRGQEKAWNSKKRFVVVVAGSQGGKTVLGPHWLLREIKSRGPGDYLVAAPSFPLLSKKTLPEFLKLFGRQLRLGRYYAQAKLFVFSAEGQKRIHGDYHPDKPTQVFFGHASDPDSLESATVKAAWLDEAGQKAFKLGSWEAIQRRLSIHQGRALITTTPYAATGWLKTRIYDPWKKANGKHPEIEVVRFDSTENPSFPKEEFDRARRELPGWRFNLFYRGIFTRPAGMIYDCFDATKHIVPRFRIPSHWPRWGGLDFGAVNTAAVFLAEELGHQNQSTGRFFVYREYKPGKREPERHAEALAEGEPCMATWTGGSASEDEWRERFGMAGIPVSCPPVKDVEVGIDTVYSAFAKMELFVIADLEGLIEEIGSYSRILDDAGEATEKIEGKENFHLADALRYVCIRVKRLCTDWTADVPEESMSLMSAAPF